MPALSASSMPAATCAAPTGLSPASTIRPSMAERLKWAASSDDACLRNQAPNASTFKGVSLKPSIVTDAPPSGRAAEKAGLFSAHPERSEAESKDAPTGIASFDCAPAGLAQDERFKSGQ